MHSQLGLQLQLHELPEKVYNWRGTGVFEAIRVVWIFDGEEILHQWHFVLPRVGHYPLRLNLLDR